jgi:ABC-type uncharacterized transport system ATPase subunit
MSAQTARETVKDLLMDHRGSDNPITSREINDRIDEDSIGSFPETRQIIREIIVEDQVPIAAGSQGYYVIETEEELREYVNNLDERTLSIVERKQAVLRAADDWEDKIETSTDDDLL